MHLSNDSPPPKLVVQQAIAPQRVCEHMKSKIILGAIVPRLHVALAVDPFEFVLLHTPRSVTSLREFDFSQNEV